MFEALVLICNFALISDVTDENCGSFRHPLGPFNTEAECEIAVNDVLIYAATPEGFLLTFNDIGAPVDAWRIKSGCVSLGEEV